MPSTDSIADLLAALNNASRASLDSTRVSNSKFRQRVLQVLQAEGFIRSFQVHKADGGRETLEIRMHYGPKRERLFNGFKRLSRPGRRRYAGLDEIKPYLRRMETLLVSTSRGVVTGAQAVSEQTGGELIGQVW